MSVLISTCSQNSDAFPGCHERPAYDGCLGRISPALINRFLPGVRIQRLLEVTSSKPTYSEKTGQKRGDNYKHRHLSTSGQRWRNGGHMHFRETEAQASNRHKTRNKSQQRGNTVRNGKQKVQRRKEKRKRTTGKRNHTKPLRKKVRNGKRQDQRKRETRKKNKNTQKQTKLPKAQKHYDMQPCVPVMYDLAWSPVLERTTQRAVPQGEVAQSPVPEKTIFLSPLPGRIPESPVPEKTILLSPLPGRITQSAVTKREDAQRPVPDKIVTRDTVPRTETSPSLTVPSLQTMLQEYFGLSSVVLRSVPGDGSCFFYAVGPQEEMNMEKRKRAVVDLVKVKKLKFLDSLQRFLYEGGNPERRLDQFRRQYLLLFHGICDADHFSDEQRAQALYLVEIANDLIAHNWNEKLKDFARGCEYSTFEERSDNRDQQAKPLQLEGAPKEPEPAVAAEMKGQAIQRFIQELRQILDGCNFDNIGKVWGGGFEAFLYAWNSGTSLRIHVPEVEGNRITKVRTQECGPNDATENVDLILYQNHYHPLGIDN